MLKRDYTLPYRVFFVAFSVFIVLVAFIPSLTVNAVPVAPTSASLEILKDQTVVSKVAVKSKVTLQASKVSGGSANGGYYEYMFQVKEPGATSFAKINNYNRSQSCDYTLVSSGLYTFRAYIRTVDGDETRSQALTIDKNLSSVDVINNSIISNTAISLGDSITINASGSGGSNYEYKYWKQLPGDPTWYYLLPSAASSEFVTSASTSFKPDTVGTYSFRVYVRDKDTGASSYKDFTVNVSTTALTNNCSVSPTGEVNFDSNNKGKITINVGAANGKSPYQYNVSYTLNDGNTRYVIGSSANNYVTQTNSKEYTLPETGTYRFTFKVKDANGKTSEKTQTIRATANGFENTSTISSTSIDNKSGFTITGSAKGGTGEYSFEYYYIIPGTSDKVVIAADTKSTKETVMIPELIYSGKLAEDYVGEIDFYVKAINLDMSKDKKFTVKVSKAKATAISRMELMELYENIITWETGLAGDVKENLEKKEDYQEAKNAAFAAITSDVVVDYNKPYFDLYNEKKLVDKDIQDGNLNGEFFMTEWLNGLSGFYSDLVAGLGDSLALYSDPEINDGNFNFDLQGFVDEFSGIFTVFASSLLVLIFGVNLIRTSVTYELMTLKGLISVFGRLILAELWIQLSTKICILIVKIFSELMKSIISAIGGSSIAGLSLNFTAKRSGLSLVGNIVDVLQNYGELFICGIILLLLIVLFLIVYIKLTIRSIEIAMLTVVSPVFFACSAAEVTMPYFKKFINAFLSVSAEIVFMGVVYLAYVWFSKDATIEPIILEELYTNSEMANKWLSYLIGTIACGYMMIHPPKILRDLVTQ